MEASALFRRFSIAKLILFLCIFFTFFGVLLLHLSLNSIDPPSLNTPPEVQVDSADTLEESVELETTPHQDLQLTSSLCATVEEMGEEAVYGKLYWKESLKLRNLIHHHFSFHGAPRVRDLPPEQFCKQGFVMAKASEAGFGNEMYKILTAAGLSIMLNRSLIIGQTRHIGESIRFISIFPIRIHRLH
jgi:hypothetical protein